MSPEELDLHALSVGQALELFVRHYNQRLGLGLHDEIVVVHGYGASGAGGEIRTRLRAFLQQCADFLAFEPGERAGAPSLLGRNPGVTIVYPRLPLPPVGELIAGEVLAFCAEAKTQDKIVGKFRVYGEPAVAAALRTLERQGRLKKVYKGKHKAYVAAN